MHLSQQGVVYGNTHTHLSDILKLGFRGEIVKDVVEQLKGAVQRDLHPAGRLLDALSAIVRAPPLDEAQS